MLLETVCNTIAVDNLHAESKIRIIHCRLTILYTFYHVEMSYILTLVAIAAIIFVCRRFGNQYYTTNDSGAKNINLLAIIILAFVLPVFIIGHFFPDAWAQGAEKAGMGRRYFQSFLWSSLVSAAALFRMTASAHANVAGGATAGWAVANRAHAHKSNTNTKNSTAKKSQNTKSSKANTSSTKNASSRWSSTEVIEAGSSSSKNTHDGHNFKTDDLRVIDGVGPKVLSILNKNNIKWFHDLAGVEVSKLTGIFAWAGKNFESLDFSTWGHQATLAADGKWDELESYKLSLKDTKKEAVAKASVAAPSVVVHRHEEKTHTVEAKKVETKTESTVEVIEAESKPVMVISEKEMNDIQKINGIGPKLEEVLHGSNIKSFQDILDTPMDTLKDIIKNAGSNFSLIDPSTWHDQAAIAVRGAWDEFEKFQDNMK